jgi:hypothetical protein
LNYLTQINGFWAKAESSELSGIDISVYMSLLNYCNKLNWLNPFVCHWDIVCQTSKVSKNTYYSSIQRLNDLGFIVYSQGIKNTTTKPKIFILEFENNEGIIKEQRGNKEGTEKEQQGNLYKQLNLETNKHINDKITIAIPSNDVTVKKVIEDNYEIVSANIENWVNDYKEEIDAIGSHWINQFIVEKKCKRLKRMEVQMDSKTMESISKKYKREFIEEVLLEMENWKDTVKKNTNVGLTLQNWLNRKGEHVLTDEYRRSKDKTFIKTSDLFG